MRILGLSILAWCLSACSSPGDEAVVVSPPRAVALGTSFNVLVARSIDRGPLCPRAGGAALRPSNGAIHDCSLGADQVEVLEAQCDDDACEREASAPADYLTQVRLRAKKAGTATLRVRVRGSDGVEVSSTSTVEIVAAARFELVGSPIVGSGAELDDPFAYLSLAPGMAVERRLAIVSETGERLQGLPDLLAAPGVSWAGSDEGSSADGTVTAVVRAETPGVIPFEVHAGPATLREDISVVAVDPSAAIRLHVLDGRKLGPPLEDIDVYPGEYQSFALSAGGPDARAVLVPASSVAFDPAPGITVGPMHTTPGTAWVTLSTSLTPPPGGSTELRARGRVVARLHWKDGPQP